MGIIYQSESWIKAEEEDLNDDFIISVFSNDIHQVIYVYGSGGGYTELYQ